MPRPKHSPIARPKVQPSTKNPIVIKFANTKQIKKPKQIRKDNKDLTPKENQKYKDVDAAMLMSNDYDILNYKLSLLYNKGKENYKKKF